LPFVANRDPRVITVRRSTLVRIGVAVLVLAALGGGFAIGFTVHSKSSNPNTEHTTNGGSTTSTHPSATTSSVAATTTTEALPAVLSCGPASTPHVRPANLMVGCGAGGATVTGITWNEWGKTTGGQGTGTLNVDLLSTPAIVVVFNDVNGVFQDVSVSPTQSVTTTTTTGKSGTPASGPTTSQKTGALVYLAASQRGCGWGVN
jgi:hypothetical protein